MTPPGQLLPLSRLPPGLSSRCPPPAHAQARVSLLHPWAHRLHGRFMPSPHLFRSPACPLRAPTPPGVSAAAGGEAQAAAVAEFVTSERVKVAAMLGLALALCNADRVVMSVAIVPLSQAYGWTPSFAGVVQSSFLWGYLMSPIIGGALVDYYGGKRVMAYGVALWSLATFLSPWAAGRSIWLFLFTRVLLGIAEGVALPSMNNMVLRWFPRTERSSAVGIAMAGFQLGNTIGLLLSPIIMSRTGIFGPFVIFGLFGFLWVLVWIPAISGTPGEHAQISAYELKYITKGQKLVKPQIGSEKTKKGYFVILSWMPVYFKTIYHVNLREAAWFSALPWVMMAVLGYVAGVVSDMLIRNGTDITLTRKIMQSIGFLGPGIALLCLNAAKSPIIASAWLTVAVGLKSFGHSGFLVNLQEIAPQYAGVLHGMSNTAGTFAAILGTIGAGTVFLPPTIKKLFAPDDKQLQLRLYSIGFNFLKHAIVLDFLGGIVPDDVTWNKQQLSCHLRIPSAMQAARDRTSPAGHGGFSGFNSESQSDPGFSWTSTYTPRSRMVNRKARSSISFRERVAAILGSCANCFTPRPEVKEAHENPPIEAHDVSASPSNFGTVYKAKLRDGSIIAVKRATKMRGGHLSEEFRSEIQMLSKVEHLNLVKFLGYVEYEDERLILVEYVNNGTLRQHLDGSKGEPLEFAQRLNIAIDIVHAIAYLHGYTASLCLTNIFLRWEADHPIIHRDIKSSNILLTEHLRAKVADFGFARLAPENPEATHVSTLVKGTAGYVDPEYLRTSQLTDRSDVYSFGVLLIELVTGRRPIERGRGRGRHQRLTTEWVKQAHPNKTSASDTEMYRT
ncbi:putative anion transporter 3, chloroplastic [Zea mays]|uniref:Putative anion transporter 3, chloroplastic n=1 Tax=Zea mays TaxID=4577 RepID=A0A3L6FKN5_MAIZE|nr:putative anion transporter 3, chloroplastic [Zea mays]